MDKEWNKECDKVVYFSPSLYAHVINAILLLTAVILLFSNYSKIIQLNPYKKIILVVLFSIMIGVHGLSHLGLESTYGYNPMIIEQGTKVTRPVSLEKSWHSC